MHSNSKPKIEELAFEAGILKTRILKGCAEAMENKAEVREDNPAKRKLTNLKNHNLSNNDQETFIRILYHIKTTKMNV